MEIKKSNSAQLEDKRVTFFLLGLLLAFTFIFVGLQYQRGQQGDDDLSESMEDLSQDLEMSARPDQKDMVSAEAVAKAPASQGNYPGGETYRAANGQKAPQKISSTTSELVIGDGSGVVDGADVKEAAPETPGESGRAEAPIKLTVVQKIPQFPGGWSAFMQWLTKNLKYPVGGAEEQDTGHRGGNLYREQGWKYRQYQGKYLGRSLPSTPKRSG